MEPHGERDDVPREPRGFLPLAEAPVGTWRRMRGWLFGGRARIDQEGLLAERTLLVAPRRRPRDDREAEAGSPRPEVDDYERA